MAPNQSKNVLSELDERHFGRNQKTTWLQYLDKLTAWLWQDNEGAARWTLILDDALRRAAVNHPPKTAAGSSRSPKSKGFSIPSRTSAKKPNTPSTSSA